MRTSIALTSLFTLAALASLGCGAGPAATAPVAAPILQATGMNGHVHGGQQPVFGATIQLYKAATTGYGVASTALLASTVKTDSNGSFNFPQSAYTCSPADQLYIVATGGDPSGSGGTSNNSALAMMAGLGRCDGVTASTFVSINELTTVATAYALAPFMSSLTQVSTSAANITGLANAFAAIPVVVNTASGVLPGPALPTGATIPTTEINTLADILAVCVNTVDAGASQSSACNTIFAAAKPSTTAPTNTVQAALNLAQHPTLGLTLGSMVSGVAPFQPYLTGTPNDWTIAIVYSGGGLSTPKGIAADINGNIWVANAASSVSKFGPSGAALSGTSGYTATGLASPTAIAVDATANAWVANSAGTVTKIPASGAGGVTYTGGGTTSTTGIAIDAASNVWISGTGTSKISEFASNGTAVSTTGYSVVGPSTAIAINPK